MNAPKTQEQAKAMAIIIAVVFAVILAAYLAYRLTGASDSLLESLGLKKSDEDKALDKIKVTIKEADFFSPTYWRNPPAQYKNAQGKYLASVKYQSAVDAIVKQIENAVGYIYDNPEQIASAMEEMKNKAQVSQVSEGFAKKYKKSLYQYLSEKMDTSAQRAVLFDILTRLNSLPSGFTKPN